MIIKIIGFVLGTVIGLSLGALVTFWAAGIIQ